MDRRYQQSGLDERITLADFDWRFNPKLPRAACFELHTLKFVAQGYNAIIVGKPGTGKSHVAKAVAYQASLQGHNVRYLEATSAFGQYALGDLDEQQKQLRILLDANLLILDDLLLARHISEAGGRTAATAGAPALQAQAQHRSDLQSRCAGLGLVPR